MRSRMTQLAATLTGLFLTITAIPARRRDERGGGTSVETVLIVAGCIVLAGIVIAGIRAYVQSHMPK